MKIFSHEKGIDFLLHYLLDEGKYDEPMPKDDENKWLLFRSLINVREAKPVSDEFLVMQDEFLQSQTKKKGITDISNLISVRDNFYLWQGDITALKADAIVNAANSGMLGCFVPCHACIDNVIHTFAGVQLRLECAEIMKRQGYPEPTGKAKITAAYNLPSRYILHTVGAIVKDKVTDENRRHLASCYSSCLELAEQNGIESIAFCCISTGEFRFPNVEAAEIAVETVNKYLVERNSNIKVIFNVFKKTDYEIYERLLGANRQAKKVY